MKGSSEIELELAAAARALRLAHRKRRAWLKANDDAKTAHKAIRAKLRSARDAKRKRNELRVKELFMQGLEHAEIALVIGVSLRTVKDYFQHMYRQYGITSGNKRVKLAVLLYREGKS